MHTSKQQKKKSMKFTSVDVLFLFTTSKISSIPQIPQRNIEFRFCLNKYNLYKIQVSGKYNLNTQILLTTVQSMGLIHQMFVNLCADLHINLHATKKTTPDSSTPRKTEIWSEARV